jgi:hypothetical protein
MSKNTVVAQEILDKKRSSSLQEVLMIALPYHFSNFEKLEKIGTPYAEDGENVETFEQRIKANSLIKFEVQAYINHLRRLKHHIKYLQKEGKISPPINEEIKKVWDDLMLDDGIINLIANKWAVHRSFDDPHGENLTTHLEILLNFEGTITMWGNGHMYLSLGKHEFFLYHYHNSAMKFIEWFFTEVRRIK